MAAYNQYLVTIRTKFDTIQVVVGAMDPSSAGRAAQAMHPGSSVLRVEKIRGA